MFSTRVLLILIPLFPLLGAILAGVLGPRILRRRSHWPVIVGCVASFLCSLLLSSNVRKVLVDPSSTDSSAPRVGYEEVHRYWTWASIEDAYPQDATPIPAGDDIGLFDFAREFRIDVALRADPLTVIMLVMVTFIGSLIAIYSVGYMQGDRGYWRFFSYISLFVFCMTMLVSVSNFLMLYVFWEGVGLCSYLLIGFWYEKPAAAAAGMKAFLVNRVGDFGFALAVFLIWTTYGTLNFHDTESVAGVLGQARLESGVFAAGGVGLAICLLLMLGACGKSAQFPLHVWLPDAMEGPTPVSALIHAATMVTAGVYLVTRCTPLFMVSPTAQVVVACIGGGTALMAGLIALTQFDLKRVLAYSTISQLGYMFMALGTGTLAGITAGMFHLFTHAFFKALLFLGSGSVMHAMGGVIDIRQFGGLRRLMPITHWTFAVGCLALAGVFPFAGFWSKDAIVGAVHDQAVAMRTVLDERGAAPSGEAVEQPSPGEVADQSHAGGHAVTTAHLAGRSTPQLQRHVQIYQWLYYLSLVTALLTAIYTFRVFFLTFYGDEEIPAEAGDHAHESPASMWVPLTILAAFALLVGLVLEQTHAFQRFLGEAPSLATATVQATPAPGVFHMQIAVLSTAVALFGIAVAAFLYLGDQLEATALARLFDSAWLGKCYRWSRDKFFLDEIYEWLVVKPLAGLAQLAYFFDRWVIDGLVNLCGWIPQAIGGTLRRLQMGLVPFYGLAMVLGMLALLAIRVMWGNS